MDEKILVQICLDCLGRIPDGIRRCSTGLANYVYLLEAGGEKYILRCSQDAGAYGETVHWLKKLSEAGVPVPSVLRQGNAQEYEYLLLTYLEGEDLGEAYPKLSEEDKRAIAREVVRLQTKAGSLTVEAPEPGWTWRTFIDDMLALARQRIVRNGYFDAEKVDRLSRASARLESYFAGVKPVVYLDDITTKNLLIHEGRVSGVIDVDWIGVGDVLTFVALTNMALLNLGYDTDYVRFLLEEMQLSEEEKTAFLFYNLLYCVDFMGERGTCFLDKTVEAGQETVNRLNGIYDQLWKEWQGRA